MFEFATAARIVFGAGTASSLDRIAREYGTRPFLVTGNSQRISIDAAANFQITTEPTVDIVRAGRDRLRDSRCDVVIAVGGGSVIDGAKAIAALASNEGDPLDYLEVIGRGQAITKLALPTIAVPTTAGTGAEVTRNAVLGSPEHRVKASLRSPLMLPRVAVVDPDLTLGLPPHLTAATGLDALTQLIEPYVSARANAMVDMFCVEGITRIVHSLRKAWRGDHDARFDMSFASLLGGLSLANAGLGVVHGFAAPIGGMFDAPHGAVCAAILPHGMEANIRALRSRASEHPALARYQHIGVLFGGATAEDAVERVRQLVSDLEIPPLRRYGLGRDDVAPVAAKAAQASSMKANPLPLTPAELEHVLAAAL